MAENNEAKGGGAEYRVFQKFYRDLISIIPITDLSPYLASENIITPTDDEEVTSPSTPTERARTLLLKISAHLKAGYSDSLRGLLDAMEKFGNQNCLELASKVKKDLELLVGEIQSSSHIDVLTVEDFQNCGNPTTAFHKLSSIMEKYFSDAKFSKIRRGCMEHIRSPGIGQFSAEFTGAISKSVDLDELLDILAESNYWNWIDLRIMEAMVMFSDNSAAESTLKSYKEYVSAITLEKVLPEIPIYVDEYSKYVTIEEKFSPSSVKDLTIGQILSHRYIFSYEVLDINPNVPKLCSIKTGCLQLLWSIPRECALHAYKSAFVNIGKIESILYIKIEYFPTIYSQNYSQIGQDLPECNTLPDASMITSLESKDHKIHFLRYFKPFTVSDKFSSVVNQVTKLVQSCDPKLLIEQCKSLKCSDVHDIRFFSEDQLNQLKEYRSTPLFLQELSHLWSWSNHSVLRVLVGFCDEAIRLLDEFDCQLDPLEPIMSYAVSKEAPINLTTHAILEIKCNGSDIQDFSLQNAMDISSLIINKCNISQYCLKLLMATQGFITLHWSIPKCVMYLINARVQQRCSYFHKKGVLEVVVHPCVRINTSGIPDLDDNTIKMQELSKQLQHVHKKYESVLNDNKKLKQYEDNLSASLQVQEKIYKELQEKYNKLQEVADGKRKERSESYQSEFGKIKVELEKVFKAFNIDSEVKRMVIATTEVEKMQEPEYEMEYIQKMLEQLQHYATEAKGSMDMSVQQQSDINDLTAKLDIKEKEIAKLKDANRILLKNRSGRKELEQVDVKVNKYPIQYEFLGSGNYGKVQKVNYKDKSYAGKLFNSEFLPGYPNVSMDKLFQQFTLTSSRISKFSHPNIEQFVEIAHADDKGVPMIITELLNENLTDYITRTSVTLHYNLQLSMCNDMTQGLLYLHSQQLVHGNLHGANVLMANDHAKIADYLCPLLLPGVPPVSSSPYLPPETTQNKRTTVQSNVFTLSVLFLQVITKLYPQPSSNMNISELERRRNDLDNVYESHPLLALIQRCLSNRDIERPLMSEILDHLTQMLKDKDSTQMMVFKLIHTTEYPLFVPSLTSGTFQLKHVTCQNLPVPMYWAYAVTIGMMVYVTGGNSRNGDAVEHIYRYDLEKNKWDKLPPSQYHHCVPVVLEGKLSLIGGRVPRNKAVIRKVNTYNEDTKQWITVYPDMNHPRYRPAVVTIDCYVIVLGGKIKERSILTDTIEIMNVKDKQWTVLATPLPDKMYDMSATISHDLVWIIGYDNGKNRSNKVFTVPLDPLISLTKIKHSWRPLRYDTVCYKTAVIASSDPPVILGGDDRQNKTVAAVVAFDHKTDSWSEVAMLSTPRAHSAVAKLPNERGIIVIGGCSETKNLSQCNSSCLNTTEIYYCSNTD